ncbi:carbon-nitrogen hydrolase family protein [Fictibacillus sp. BK138]|jgi:deaminated glutathione amidase|uniref:carbon-nitrogen hydrolase family protein n=1 Tax=Fictibacillus sp. BK138 TaxID=2512121 RepID=UPI00102A5984|nr:carbon-nitrogen hydrolase family protein [Fictibacillus sp. BK138]RZT16483.1 putative amidohydrolase [Fictibacillus sp. BK138]
MNMVVATCQFPVSADIKKNQQYIMKQMRIAKEKGADVAHFPEAALSGYAGTDMPSLKGFDWELLKNCTEEILEYARDLRIWVVLGTTHPLTGNHKPHNSLYIINAAGELVDRYDKMFCAGDETEQTGDLAHYTSGNYFCTFEINGVKCGAQICHDYRYPELYRVYKKKGVQVMFHSYHAANMGADRLEAIKSAVGKENLKYNHGMTYPEITMPATMTSYAANNFIWISASNSSAKESCWPAFFVRADGVTVGKLRRNVPGVLITEVDTAGDFYDSTVAWRDRSMNGDYYSGTLVEDLRSTDRRSF